jgi:hypothetical protein
MAENTVGISESTAPNKLLRSRSHANSSAETVHVEVVALGGEAGSSDFIQPTTADPAGGAFALPVRQVGSHAISGNATVSPAGGSSWHIEGNTTAVLTTGSTGRVELSSGGLGGSSGSPLYVQPATTVPISGNTTAIVGNSSGAFSTANPLPVLLQSSTATVTIQGNTTAILSTASKIQVEPGAGSTFNISGNATAVVANASGGIASGNPLHVFVQGSTATVTVQGNTSVALSTASTGRVELASGGVGGTSGNPLHVTPTTTVPIAGNTTAIVANSSGTITTANPLAVFLQGSTATVSIQGNTTAILSTASIVRVEPAAGTTFNVGGNTTARVSTADWAVMDFDTSAGSTHDRVAVGIVVPSTAGPVLLGTTAGLPVTLSTNSTLAVQVQNTVTIQGNSTAVVGNASGVFTTANPLPVYLQGSTAAVSIQGNATVAGNVTAILSTASVVRVETGSSGFAVSGNVSAQVTPAAGTTFNVAGNVTAILSTAFPAYSPLGGTTAAGGLIVFGTDGSATNSTARALRVDASGKLLVDAAVTIGGLAQINATAGSTMLLVGGMDGNTSNSTARALRVNASGELLVVGGTLNVGGIAQINTTGGSTMLIVGGMDGTSSNSTARALRVDASGKLLVDAAVTIGGLVDPGATAGTTAMLMAGADGQSSNSTAWVLLTDASGKLQVNVLGNTSVVGNVSALMQNSSGTITTANPLAVLLQGSTATVTIQGNATALITTGSIIQVEPKAGAVFPISGNTTARVSTADWAVMDFDTSAGATLDRVAVGIVVPSTAGPVLLGTTAGLPVTLSTNSTLAVQVQNTVTIAGNATAAVANSSGLVTTANPLAVFLQGSTATISIQGNATIGGNVSANVSGSITSGSILRLDWPAAAPYVAFNGTTASGGLVAMGLDGTATNATARPLQVNASGELKIAGALTVTPAGNASINATAGSTMILVGGADGGTSNATARALHVNASRELVVTGAVAISGNSTVHGNVTALISTAFPPYSAFGGASASGGLVVMGTEGTATNSTARPLRVNASQELVITGAVQISGNATIAGNTTAVVGNASGVFTTANPLPVYLQGSTATVSIQGNTTVAGNVTAILSTASIVRAELTSGGLGGSTAAPFVVAAGQLVNQAFNGTGAISPAYSVISVTATGVAQVIASATGAILVLAAQFNVGTTCTLQWFDGSATALTGIQTMAAAGGFVWPYNPLGWIKTATGQKLSVGLQNATGPLGGSLTYVRVPS